MPQSTNEAPMFSCCYYKVFGNESVALIWCNAVMYIKEFHRTISFTDVLRIFAPERQSNYIIYESSEDFCLLNYK